MDGKVAPEFAYEQSLYYPATGNYYGYLPTGMEQPKEWDGHHNFLGLNGQDVQFSGLQTESVPYVYYAPSYEYPQSPYNPYNPYIPGAVIGTDNPFVGSQQCFTNSPYLQSLSPPNYAPVVNQSVPNAPLNGYADQYVINGGATKYEPPLSSVSVNNTPLKVPLENLSLEPSWSSHPIQVSGRLGEGAVVNTVPTKQLLPYGALTNGSAPQMIQKPENLPHGGVPSVHSSIKVALPANNGFTKLRSNIPEWAPVNRMKPQTPYSGFSNRCLGEQNMGPRTQKPRVQLASTTVLKLDDNITVYEDQYNRDDFPVDYPDAKFFVIKSYSEDDVHKSIKYNVWSSTSSGNKKLDIAYEEAQKISVAKSRKCPVFLFFSVNASGHFCGVAEMIGPVDFHKDMDFWLQDKWTGSFPVKWHIVKDIPNSSFRHIILVNNEYRPVTSSRDTQEIPYLPGINMLTISKNIPLKTSVLDAFTYYEERQRIMQEEKFALRRKSCVTSSSLPPVITLDKPVDAINGSPVASESETKVNCEHSESNGRKPVDHTAGEDIKAESLPNNSIKQPVKANADIANDVSPPLETGGREINHNKLDQSSESTQNQGKHQRATKDSGRLDPSDVVGSQDKEEASPDDDNGSLSTSSKPGETEILTVGSMQINIADSSSSFTGPLTVGSTSLDNKG